MADFTTLRAADTLIVLNTGAGARPSIIYAGPDLPGVPAEELATLQTGQHIPGGPEEPITPSLLNAFGTGWPGPAGLIAHSGGKDWALDPRISRVERISDYAIAICCEDPAGKITVRHYFAICPTTGVLETHISIERNGDQPMQLEWLAAACLPLDERLTKLRTFNGKWASEFQIEEIDRFRGTYLRENKAGRTSHGDFPGLFAGTATSSDTGGLAAAFHLGWSGNSRMRIDTGQDGRVIFQAGELLFPGEMELGKYQTPSLYAGWSNNGYGDISQRMHSYLKREILPQRADPKPRPIHYNTWEAVYFDHCENRILDLVAKAAGVGAERFVIDDGWFGGRRSDKAGLGDWWVSPDAYPGGLHTIAKRVRKAGMEFGLWFEPEMVNPDSDLYRAHPGWVLRADEAEPIPSRHQLTLDLTKREVTDYLFDKISALIAEYEIDYIKWDMNRDTQHPGSQGHAVMHRQTAALYALIDRFRDAHPNTEIESCASGGARADYGILQRTDRIWTSDNNDARHRHQIMRGASHFLPLCVLGNHVGPKKCHITGRIFSMEFRAASAIFGHMGMELDLARESEADRATLSRAITLHKQHRELIHDGDFHRLAAPEYLSAMGCTAADRSEGLFSSALLDIHPAAAPPRLRLSGLAQDRFYRTRLVWPPRNPSLSSPSIIDAADLLGEGALFSGSALMEHGLQLPLTMPDTCLIFHLRAED